MGLTELKTKLKKCRGFISALKKKSHKSELDYQQLATLQELERELSWQVEDCIDSMEPFE